MKFGLTEGEYKFIKWNVVDQLEKSGAKIWCFGSRARGNYQKFSDLDLLIEVSEDVSRSISDITELLENSNFPYKVDLVKNSEIAESYRPGIEKEKVRF